MSVDDRVSIFKSLFRGRNDIYAVRWERDGKSGYRPAYDVDWNGYQEYKAKGGTFATYTKKAYAPLDDKVLIEHFTGVKTVGIYPLLTDNSSFFAALDFDEGNWQQQIQGFHSFCANLNIPAYIERSRSGKGGHLWIFFKERIPAVRSRALLREMLIRTGILSCLKKDLSFDRMFPNQDVLTGKGLGNLIALPLQGYAVRNGNTCFLDPVSFSVYPDQWQFLTTIKKLTAEKFNEIFEALLVKNVTTNNGLDTTEIKGQKLSIVLDSKIHIAAPITDVRINNFLKEELNFTNAKYFLQQNLGKSTHNVKKFICLIDEKDTEIIVPRGFIGDLLRFCRNRYIRYEFHDRRYKGESIKFSSQIILKDYQVEAVESATKKDFGIIQMPPGAGKTIVGIELIARKGQKALILVHRTQLFDQWVEKLKTCLGLGKSDIGQIGKQKHKVGTKVTVAMLQSLLRSEFLDEYKNEFGLIIVDECHHIPATSFSKVIGMLNCYYLYGLTATAYKKGCDAKIINMYLGNKIFELEQKNYLQENKLKVQVKIRNTDLFVPFNAKSDSTELLSNILVFDSARNNLIVKDILECVDRFKTILVLTERKSHIDVLYQYLKGHCQVVAICGEDSQKSRIKKFNQIKKGEFNVVLSTGQFFGEGVDISTIECLFIVYPFSFKGKLVQYIGRVMRSKNSPCVYDYHDEKISYFSKMFKARNAFYKKILDAGA